MLCALGIMNYHQVCSYRCIASYESPLLESFSLCILQVRRDIRMCQLLTHSAIIFLSWHTETQLLGVGCHTANCTRPGPNGQFPRTATHTRNGRGHVCRLVWTTAVFLEVQGCTSWLFVHLNGIHRVAAGVNAAYDYFPCQFQLFYRGQVWCPVTTTSVLLFDHHLHALPTCLYYLRPRIPCGTIPFSASAPSTVGKYGESATTGYAALRRLVPSTSACLTTA